MTRLPLALAYHCVDDVPLRDDPHRLFVRPSDLRGHLKALERWGYGLLTFGDWARGVREGRGEATACLTFDDATADLIDGLLPILRDTGAPATVFAVSGWLGREYPYSARTRVMTAAELTDVAAAGVEVGAHTVTHPDLTGLDHDAALEELSRSRNDLEQLLERPVTVAAYPFGRADREVIGACRAAGFEAACRTSGQGSLSNPFDLPRQDMDNRCSRLGFRLKRDDRYEPLMRVRAVRALRRASLTARR